MNMLTDQISKLFQLENIEEEFGIDLITLFNIYKKLNIQKSIYIKMDNEIKELPIYTCYFIIDFNEMAFREYDHDFYDLYFEDYAKIWALTREELEEVK